MQKRRPVMLVVLACAWRWTPLGDYVNLASMVKLAQSLQALPFTPVAVTQIEVEVITLEEEVTEAEDLAHTPLVVEDFKSSSLVTQAQGLVTDLLVRYVGSMVILRLAVTVALIRTIRFLTISTTP